MAISQSDAGRLIRQRKPFKAGNVYAEVVNGTYAAYSYGEHFPLAVFCPEEGWLINCDQYSPSTSRQQSKTSIYSLPGCQSRNTLELRLRITRGDAAHHDERTIQRVTRRITENAFA
jgi:hypothetical protein